MFENLTQTKISFSSLSDTINFMLISLCQIFKKYIHIIFK